MLLVLVVLVLTVITISSIRSGPSVQNAITAIRVAQGDLAQAQRVDRRSEFATLSNADAALTLARQALEEGRYEEAILAAHKASQLARKVG
jgi:nitrogen fixation/metabolism regulation signal transduction histidine kinase